MPQSWCLLMAKETLTKTCTFYLYLLFLLLFCQLILKLFYCLFFLSYFHQIYWNIVTLKYSININKWNSTWDFIILFHVWMDIIKFDHTNPSMTIHYLLSPFPFLFFLKNFQRFILFLCIWVYCSCTDGCEPSCDCWELNLGPLLALANPTCSSPKIYLLL